MISKIISPVNNVLFNVLLVLILFYFRSCIGNMVYNVIPWRLIVVYVHYAPVKQIFFHDQWTYICMGLLCNTRYEKRLV